MQSSQVSKAKLYVLVKAIDEYRKSIKPEKDYHKEQRRNLRVKKEVINQIINDIDKTIKSYEYMTNKNKTKEV